MNSPPDSLPTEAREVLIAANPRAGARWQGGLIEDLVAALNRADFTVRVFHDFDQLTARVREATQAGCLRAVVAAGGDGTVCRIAQETPPGTPLAILPLGTENLLSKYLRLTADAPALAQIIKGGRLVRLDAGQANGRLFNLMAGCGFDAEVVRRLHSQRQGHIQHWSYAQPIFDSVLNYNYPELRVRYEPASSSVTPTTDEWPVLTARWVFVVNLPRYAGGLSFWPAASGGDGLLDICTFREGSLASGLMYLGGVFLGQHENWQDFQHVQSRRLVVEADGEVPFQIDGDPGGTLPVEIEVLPQRLTLLVDEAWAAKHTEIVDGNAKTPQ